MSAEVIVVATGAPAGAGFTTRAGGVSGGPFASLNLGPDRDDPDGNVRENRRRACDALGVDAASVSANRQVHGADVRAVDGAPDGGFVAHLRDWPEADGLVTGAADAPLAVLGADCLPVLMWRRDRPRVGAAHAGWRGLVAGVLEATVAGLGDPAATGVAIGPGIGPCCYPVSPEVRDRFAARFGDAVLAGEAVDLALAARRALVAAGVPDAAIATVPACTSCEEARFFSYRRDGRGTGRQAGIVWAGAA
ncbi:MAG TPA: polyphenol oxidase family protein [Miltoncostaeaceae bacterium]|nr:polyphenol oxidase family protein [Miltoncostaeaceae bacterium]